MVCGSWAWAKDRPVVGSGQRATAKRAQAKAIGGVIGQGMRRGRVARPRGRDYD